MMQLDYNPKMLFQTVAPSLGDQFVEGLGGPEATEGIFYAASWSPDADFEQNAEYVERYQEEFGTDSDEDAASAFGTAQVLQAAVEAVGGVDDQAALADWLHANTVETIQGPISWDERGAPQQSFLLTQWQGGEPQVVLPEEVASSEEIIVSKPAWG
jgi:branched-chain amino acid transport system substrate-binding protein